MLGGALGAGLQSASIMLASDMFIQLGVEERTWDDNYDIHRTFRWTLAGLTLHGPYFFYGFSKIDKYFGAATALKVVMKKTATAQFVMFPPYLVGLFGFMGLLENHPDVARKIRRKVPEAFMSGCMFWPVVNTVNFMLVPATLRVPYVAANAGIWNSYLSWTNARTETNSKIAI